MIEKLILRLVNDGKLKKQKAGFIQVENLLKEAILDLQEADKINEIAERATYLLAYNAMLKAGRALLLFKGYVPDDGAQHKTVVDIITELLGEQYKTLTGQFERMRRKRNEMTYEAGIALSKSESKKAFHDSISLLQKIMVLVKKENPQLELKLNIPDKK